MKNIAAVTIVGLALAGCSQMTPSEHAAVTRGAVIGGVAGGLIGAVATGNAGGVVVGAGIGAAVGAAIAAETHASSYNY